MKTYLIFAAVYVIAGAMVTDHVPEPYMASGRAHTAHQMVVIKQNAHISTDIAPCDASIDRLLCDCPL
jgi:hypothetical protein